MTVQIREVGDRLHVLTPGYEWTILNKFSDGRGPCYISDVRERHAPYRQVVRDGGLGHTINDPHFGGLFGFGLVASLQQEDPAQFWDRGWEITSRLDAGAAGPFGVRSPELRVEGRDVYASCVLRVLGSQAMTVDWYYEFGPGDEVACQVTLTPSPIHGLWIKEPKLVANGLIGYRTLGIHDQDGGWLGKPYDLGAFADPRRRTLQIGARRRHEYVLTATDRPTLRLTYDRGLDVWAREADPKPAMSKLCTPAYCLDRSGGGILGTLWDRTEVTRWGDADVTGLLFNGWEGGYGAPDCWACYRPWPTKTAVVNATARFA